MPFAIEEFRDLVRLLDQYISRYRRTAIVLTLTEN